jgi:ATP-dependent Lon protease
MPCAYVFKSGKKKGSPCGKDCEGMFCRKHMPAISDGTSQFLETIDALQFKFLALETTMSNKSIIIKKFRYLETLSTSSTEYQKNLNWLRHALNFPYNRTIKTPVSVKNENVRAGKDVSDYVTQVYNKLDAYIYGMHPVKEELMSFVCKRISNPNSNDHILALQGVNGIGKTRLAHGLAKALDLPIKTINMGSVNDVSYFTGHGFTYVDSEPGRIVQILNETQCKNCIIYIDEADKVHKTEKGQAIYSFLTHLIDPSQNQKFQDVYLSGLELDVSKVFFLFSFNDASLIDGTVKDRLKIINIAEPSFADKVNIAEKFLLPEICGNVNFTVDLSREILERIVREDKNDSGLRGVKRILEDLVTKLNVLRMLDDGNKEKLSFYNSDMNVMIDTIIRKHTDKDAGKFAAMYL